MVRATLCLLVLLGCGLAAPAQENPQRKSIELPSDNAMAELKPGQGVDTARANCVACHSTDYIVRQPRGDAKHWEGEVKKMIAVFGAPISEADAKAIVDYLASAYGPANDSAAPAPKKAPPPAHKEKTQHTPGR